MVKIKPKSPEHPPQFPRSFPARGGFEAFDSIHQFITHRGLGVLHHPGDRVGDVLDIGRLQLRLAASEKRKTGRRRNIPLSGSRRRRLART